MIEAKNILSNIQHNFSKCNMQVSLEQTGAFWSLPMIVICSMSEVFVKFPEDCAVGLNHKQLFKTHLWGKNTTGKKIF